MQVSIKMFGMLKKKTINYQTFVNIVILGIYCYGSLLKKGLKSKFMSFYFFFSFLYCLQFHIFLM